MAFKMKGFNPGEGTGMGSAFNKNGNKEKIKEKIVKARDLGGVKKMEKIDHKKLEELRKKAKDRTPDDGFGKKDTKKVLDTPLKKETRAEGERNTGNKKKKVKSTISDDEAKGINIENISAVQEKDGKKFVVETDEGEYYDPNEKDGIGGMDDKWDGNYNDTNNKRDTVVVNPSYNVGDLIDETEWEEGEATKKKKKK